MYLEIINENQALPIKYESHSYYGLNICQMQSFHYKRLPRLKGKQRKEPEHSLEAILMEFNFQNTQSSKAIH